MPKRTHDLYSTHGGKKREVQNQADDYDSDSSLDEGKSSTHRDTRYASSCVKILTTFLSPDYDEPQIPPEVNKSLGSGSVIALPDGSKGSKYYVLTNAHVAENSVKLYGKLSENFNKFEMEPVVIGHDCDLALLKVKDAQYEEFKKIAVPLQFGEMAESGSKIHVNGYPIDFDTPELCSTTGKVSRIRVGEYSQSGNFLLQQQVEAAINPGNSGGPVIQNGRQVGVAFQKLMGAEGFGFIIPMPVIKNFLVMALEVVKNPAAQYRGFPDIQFQYQEMENQYLRAGYQMKEDESGILLVRIDPLSSANNRLKVEDVILKVDGHPVSNEGSVFVKPDKHLKPKMLDLNFLITKKLIGDSVTFTVLRNEKGKREILNVEVPLTENAFDTKMLGPVEHKKFATYYTASGIRFVPASQNLLQNLDSIIGAFGEDGGLSETPKKSATDQLVLIQKIYESDATESYDFEYMPVELINGKKIENIHDVKQAIESNTEPMHQIVVKSGYRMTVPNMTPEEQQVHILSKFGLKSYCSDDLLLQDKHQRKMDIDAEHKKTSVIPKWLKHAVAVSESTPQKAAKPTRLAPMMANDDELASDDESEYIYSDSADEEDDMSDFIDDDGSELNEETIQDIRQTVRGMFPSLSGQSSNNASQHGKRRARDEDDERPSKRTRYSSRR